MLAKCANPSCPTAFRYVHEGRLYVISAAATKAGDKPRPSRGSGEIGYAWLCSSCSFYLTVQRDEELRAVVVQKFVAAEGRRFAT